MKGTGTAASMGPINVDGISDYNDYYWGKGPVGPDSLQKPDSRLVVHQLAIRAAFRLAISNQPARIVDKAVVGVLSTNLDCGGKRRATPLFRTQYPTTEYHPAARKRTVASFPDEQHQRHRWIKSPARQRQPAVSFPASVNSVPLWPILILTPKRNFDFSQGVYCFLR